jgi:nucleoside-diphosphate-sugar epimerase
VFVPYSDLKPSQVLPRICADFVNVQVCMMVALGLSVLYPHVFHQVKATTFGLTDAVHYYTSGFLLLSWLFPTVFLIEGFYTRSHEQPRLYRTLMLIKGVALALLLFIAINFLLFGTTLAPSTAILFSALLMSSTVLSRVAKAALLDRVEIKPREYAGRVHRDGTVLVLGGAGYIGSCLVRKLLAAGRRVRVMDSLVYGDDAIRDVLDHPNFTLQVGDCRSIQDLVAAVRGVDSIVHLAAIVGDPACEVDRRASLEINYLATRMLMEVAKGSNIRHFVFASSCSVYGATDFLVDEFSNAAPISLYGQTKADSERALLQAHSSNFHPVILRLATVFGLSYRPRFDLVVNLLTAKARAEGMITIFNGTQWRPFIHVQDVADGIVQVLNAPLEVVSGEIYNMGDERMNYTLTQVGQKILEQLPSTQIEQIENADRRNYRVSFGKIRNQIGFRCRLTLDEGIREIWDAFEDKRIVDYTDPRYYNQKFLTLAGAPACKDELDSRVMAAFASARTPGGRRQNASVLAAVAGTHP